MWQQQPSYIPIHIFIVARLLEMWHVGVVTHQPLWRTYG